MVKENYRNLSDLLKNSVPAEAYFSQLPEHIQTKAMEHSGMIHSTRSLRAMAKVWSNEGQS